MTIMSLDKKQFRQNAELHLASLVERGKKLTEALGEIEAELRESEREEMEFAEIVSVLKRLYPNE